MIIMIGRKCKININGATLDLVLVLDLLLQWIEVRWKVGYLWVERQGGSIVRVVLSVL